MALEVEASSESDVSSLLELDASVVSEEDSSDGDEVEELLVVVELLL